MDAYKGRGIQSTLLNILINQVYRGSVPIDTNFRRFLEL